MVVNLTLLPRKEFVLTLSDGTEVVGQFGTWALSRFGEKRKIGLSKITEVFTGDPSIHDLMDYVVCAVEYKERQAGKPVKFNDLKLSQWLDEYQEATGEQGVLINLLSHASGTNEEKKSQQTGLNGPISSDTQPAQG